MLVVLIILWSLWIRFRHCCVLFGLLHPQCVRQSERRMCRWVGVLSPPFFRLLLIKSCPVMVVVAIVSQHFVLWPQGTCLRTLHNKVIFVNFQQGETFFFLLSFCLSPSRFLFFFFVFFIRYLIRSSCYLNILLFILVKNVIFFFFSTGKEDKRKLKINICLHIS